MPDVVQERDELNADARQARACSRSASSPDFVTQEQPVGLTPHVSDLWWVDIDSGKAAPLDARQRPRCRAARRRCPTASATRTRTTSRPSARSLPAATSGCSSRSKRNYGNLFIADPPEQRAEGKKIWVAAIDIDAHPGHRPEPPRVLPAGPGARVGQHPRVRRARAVPRQRRRAARAASTAAAATASRASAAAARAARCSTRSARRRPTAATTSARCIGGFCGFIQGPD